MSNFSKAYRLAVKRTEQLRTAIAERDEALRCTEATLQAVTALHVAWTELAVARGALSKAIDGDTWHRAKEREIAAENALVKLGVSPEAL